MYNATYRIEIVEDRLVFQTANFRAEKGSVLHSGIFNSEMTSSLVAGGITLAITFVFFFSGVKIKPIFVVPGLIIFAVFFLVFRLLIFYDESLEAVIDKAKEVVTVSIKEFMGKKYSFPLSQIQDIAVGHIVFAPENIDGIQFVEKVALQHGTVIPGFGEKKEFYTVEIKQKNGEGIIIFSGTEKDANDVKNSIKGFIYA